MDLPRRPDPIQNVGFGEGAEGENNQMNIFEEDTFLDDDNGVGGGNDKDASASWDIIEEEILLDNDDVFNDDDDFGPEDWNYEEGDISERDKDGSNDELDNIINNLDEGVKRVGVDPSAHKPRKYNDWYKMKPKPDPNGEPDKPDPFDEDTNSENNSD